MTAALALAFFYAPPDATQGEVQRIFYIHVPSAVASYIAFGITGLASIGVLRRREGWERWDRVAASAAEIGVVFTTIVLLTGPVWGRPAQNAWWVWDARRTTTLVLWMIYAGYLVFRRLSANGMRRAVGSAVIGIVGLADIPIVHFSVVWWRNLHPDINVLRPAKPNLPGSMLLTLMVSMVAFVLLLAWFLRTRVAIELARSRLAEA